MVATAKTASQHQKAYFSFPIVRKEYTPEGDLVVYGPCTDGTLDADHQKVKPSWSGPALKQWIETGGNIRVQHSPFLYPAGKGLALEPFKEGTDQHWLKALVLRSTPAFDLVEKKVLRDFSIGVLDPVTTFDDFSAPGGTICGGQIGEVSLVDRGSNKNTSFTIVKADKDGPAELVLRLSTPMPKKVANKAAAAAARLEAYKTWIVPVQKRQLASGRVVDSSGKDRSDVAGSDFAGPGKTYPIESQGDVSDAASLAHHAKNPGKVRRRIAAIARRKWPGMTMPPSLSAAKAMKTCPACGGKGCPECDGTGKVSDKDKPSGAFPGAAPPFKKKGDAAQDYPGDRDNDDEEPADYDADEDADSKNGKKAVDSRKLRRKLIKAQRAALKSAIGGDATPAGTDFQADPGVTDSGPATARDKKSRKAGKPRKGAVGAETSMPGSDWGTKAAGPSYGMRRLHDAICPAFKWGNVRRIYAIKSVGEATELPVRELQTAAMDAVVKGRYGEAEYLTDMLQTIASITHLGPDLLLDARKAYAGLFPTAHPSQQTDIHPSQFTRGFISSGTAPLAAGGRDGNALPGAPVHRVSAQDFSRGWLAAGHASPSPGEGRQAAAGTAAFGQALTTLQRLHQHATQLWPDMCPFATEQHDYAGTDSTGIRASTVSPPPHVTVGEDTIGKTSTPKTEKRLRAKLAKMAAKNADLREENDRLGSLPDPEVAPYRGLPELDGPVDRTSLVGKAVGGADDADATDSDEFAEYVAMFANSGNPTMRANATKVLAGLLTK